MSFIRNAKIATRVKVGFTIIFGLTRISHRDAFSLRAADIRAIAAAGNDAVPINANWYES